MARATSSLPVPVSPSSSTGASVRAAVRTSALIRSITRLAPTRPASGSSPGLARAGVACDPAAATRAAISGAPNAR